MTSGKRFDRRLLALACAAALTGGSVLAQSTTGSIAGQAQPGTTITATSDTGVTRKATVDNSGRYSISSLPVGNYTVTLQHDGAVVDTRSNVHVVVNSSADVSFASANKSLDAVTVNATALPPIDVSTVDSRTVITAKQLDQLPLGRSAESIALLAPGVVSGSSYFAGPTGNALVSFGGASVSENAYYINGYNTTDPLNGLGGIGLPYGAIDQQEIFTGGYSAKYGRSTGGVINQIGKRGTNEWHFGLQAQWAPSSLSSDPKNVYYPNVQLPEGYSYSDTSLPGSLYRSRKDNNSTTTTYDAYLGGPLVKDKLFLFAAVEAQKQDSTATSPSNRAQPFNNYYTYDTPKHYIKLDWNISDSNILELTNISNKNSYVSNEYIYDYATGEQGRLFAHDLWKKTGSDIHIGKFTSYITDELTFSATYGVNKAIDFSQNPGVDPSLPYLSGAQLQNPAITGGSTIGNGNTVLTATPADAKYSSRGLRLDLEYKLGDHMLSAGIDNINSSASNEGLNITGPGYAWIYGKTNSPDSPLPYGIPAPGGDGYYVRKYIYNTATNMSVDQKSQYIEDHWQINDRWLLNVGLRNDQFTNYNNAHQAFVHNTNQWAPRLGFSWDVFGDSTFKLFGNLGRYYLALPNSVAERAASASTYTFEYFTYSGIDPSTGAPTGLKPLGSGPVSPNGEFGQTPDPKTVTATDLRSQYQDEAILGFNKMLGNSWVYGAKVTVRKLQAAIDDVCDTDALEAKAISQGIDPDSVIFPSPGSCLIFNPGRTNTFLLANADGNGHSQVTMTNSDWGFNSGVKRKYYALDMFLEHPFDGKWQGRVDYTFSRNYGNTEGQVLSTTGQDDISKTSNWDSWQLMEASNGVLSNDRTHQIKAYGAYQINPEWMISGSLQVMSGAPRVCLGYYAGPGSELDSDPTGYYSSYHYCNGRPSPLGSRGRLPWTKTVNLGMTYRPLFADKKLAITLDVFNVFNEQQPTVLDGTYETDDGPGNVSNTYGVTLYQQTPRYVRLSASYDW